MEHGMESVHGYHGLEAADNPESWAIEGSVKILGVFYGVGSKLNGLLMLISGDGSIEG